MSQTRAHTDIRLTGRIARLPEPWRSYALLARLDRPVGTWLLFLPGIWGLFLAPHATISTRLLDTALFGFGSLVMRSAGCVVNDIWDRDIDAKVTRTAGRPLASGALSLKQGLLLLAVLLLMGLGVLVCLPFACWVLAPLALLLVALYPAAKRVTWWPQLVMGFTFGFGAPMGYAAAGGSLDANGLLLYAAVIVWQLGFDTIYGFQDMDDDARIGVRSTSRLMETRARPFIGTCYGAMLVLLAIVAIHARLSWVFWPPFLLAGYFLLQQVRLLDPHDAPACLRDFRRNVPIGLILALAFVAGRLFG
ncbi:4-hydroxybenzoate octaprenyltransferase [Gluconobacter morbifer]|uniref:4-hydroxybenzoate octaprenyltransferase n=1 Tax=Gluconobacter morbifer G707 TaxID=1088869 RepID=G6XGR5_9PROT|nr:4-hydroxybenzoate octaprenyltransferase [Gluconobacter morbifer]EHH69373.1 4-hydroxybenzoate octaprenyltransferase [Gluconobacter morbifer G707]